MSDEKTLIGREIVHARYATANDGTMEDILLIKEKLHYKDGSIEPNIKVIKNFERDFYVTKPGFRNHQQKKEWEEIAKCNRFKSTQVGLATAVSKALNKPMGLPMRFLNDSPYVYGTDMSTEKIIRQEYKSRWPDCISPWTLAIMDYETDVVYGTETIISGSLTYKNKAILCYRRDFLDGREETVEGLHKMFEKHLGKYKKERNIELEIKVVDTDVQVVHVLTRKAHEWNPDIIGYWNMSFDMNHMLDAIKSHKMYPEDFFCYPKLPERFKYFKWKMKNPKKETVDGKKKTVFNEELWHKAIHPAGFYCVDLMSLYCLIRMASGKRESYKLNDVLKDELNLTKLNFTMADHLTDLKWHQFMQSKYKAEYLIYNLFDCIAVELLDEKTKDVAQSLPTLLDCSDVNTFDSNPRKLSDSLHFACLSKNLIMGSTANDMTGEDDKLQLSKSGWIATLATHLIDEGIGLKIINEAPSVTANIYGMVADLDIEGSYPTTEIILNISKETTHRELCRIKNKSEYTQRMIGLNLTNAQGNAVEISHNLFDVPTFDQLLEMIE